MAGERTSMIPVVLTVDLEPDGPGHLAATAPSWSSVPAARDWIDDLRRRAEARSGQPARVSWMCRLDPQVEEIFGSATSVLDQHPTMVEATTAQGDEWGVHVHGWRRGADGAWVDDFGDGAWIEECITRAHDAFADAFGRRCPVNSMGNRYLDDAVIACLVRQGTRVDLTAEPANGPVEDGGFAHLRGTVPDYRRTPRRPHRLAPGLIELPMTAARKHLGRDVRAHLSRMRRHGLRERLDQPVQLGGKDVPGLGFGTMMAESLAIQRRPYLAFAVRSDGVQDPVQRPRLDRHVEDLLALPCADRFAFVTPLEAIEALGAG